MDRRRNGSMNGHTIIDEVQDDHLTSLKDKMQDANENGEKPSRRVSRHGGVYQKDDLSKARFAVVQFATKESSKVGALNEILKLFAVINSDLNLSLHSHLIPQVGQRCESVAHRVTLVASLRGPV